MDTYYTKREGLKYEFEGRWMDKLHGRDMYNNEDFLAEFPIGKKDLVSKYHSLEQLLNEKWHPNAMLGAALKGDGLLTDHGIEHINAVMHHAHEILGINLKNLNGYEIYLLLIAIHFHDLGNIYGREAHETKIAEVISALGSALPLDMVEKEFVFAIAKAHGGNCEGDKDTIRYVNVDETCNGIQVRARMLAAILRFADEISDDFSRTAYDGIEIPDENKIYHAYSKTLEPVSIQGETIKFHFRVPQEYTQKYFKKADGQVLLYDEILNRLAKCMRELEYCRRYANGFISITTLNVIIDIMNNEKTFKSKEKIPFRLTLFGYPDEEKYKLEDYLDGVNSAGNGFGFLKYKTGEELKSAMKGM